MLKKRRLGFAPRIVTSIAVTVVLLLTAPTLMKMLGDRRAEMLMFGMEEAASGLGFVVWLCIGTAFMMLITKSDCMVLCSYVIVFYLASYFLLSIGARVLEGVMGLLVALTLADQRRDVRFLFITLFVVYGLLTINSNGGIVELISSL